MNQHSRSRFLIGLPLVVAAAYCGSMVLASIWMLLKQRFAINPWESAIIVDAWRTAHGINVYHPLGTGPATHMYGPLITYLNAAVIRCVGPSRIAARCISASAALATVAILTWCFCRGRRWPIWCIAAALFASQYYRARAEYAEVRPGSVAVFVSLLALLAFYRAEMSRSIRWTLLGSLLVVIAFGFKQTGAAIAMVPLAAVVLTGRRMTARELARCAIAPAMMLLTIGAMYVYWPSGFYYTIRVPGLFELRPYLWPATFWYLLSCSLLPIVLMPYVLMTGRFAFVSEGNARLLRWLFAAGLVLVGASVAAEAKRGGAANSFLPAFLVIACFSVLFLTDLAEAVTDRSFGYLAMLLVIIPAAFVADLYSVPHAYDFAFGYYADGSVEGPDVIRRVARLPGKVVCPDDPVLTLLAKGYAGRSFVCEWDSTGHRQVPQAMMDEIASADWIVRVHCIWDASDVWNPADLGFNKEPSHAFKGKAYTLWKRVAQAGSKG